jgi:hypothetical protein
MTASGEDDGKRGNDSKRGLDDKKRGTVFWK